MPFKLGLRRVVPLGRLHWSRMRLKYGARQQVVKHVDYISALPTNVGMMLNDQLSDCFEAAVYHGDQVRTLFAGGKMVTQPDASVSTLYEKSSGYNPANPNSDQGSDPAQVFQWIEKWGMPVGAGTTTKKILIASFEIDPRNFGDVLDAMDACGGLMVGLNVPSYIMPANAPPLTNWIYKPDSNILGGHEVLCGRASVMGNMIGLVSWGSPQYQMAKAFWNHYVNQVTACVWGDWVMATGKTPLGMTITQLQAEMAAIQHGNIP